MIDRNDMLELTRRMNIKRTHISRIAGCYIDSENETDGSFNTHFLKLSSQDKTKNLEIAKAIPFAGTNSELKEYRYPSENSFSRDLYKLLWELKKCRLENDAMLDLFYEIVREHYNPGFDYAVYMFFGAYDIPVKGSDKQRYGDSEEVYEYLICTISPLIGEYEPSEPISGFLFPAFADRSADLDHIDVFSKSTNNEILNILGIK